MTKLDQLIDVWKKELKGDKATSHIESFEERSAIREYDAGYERVEAERLAIEELERRRMSVDSDKVNN